MTRRARNEGSIRRRPDGRFEARVVDPVSGRRRSLFAKTEAEVLQKLREAHRAIDLGVGLGAARMSCATWFDAWIAGHRPTVKPTTIERYEMLLRVHVTPHIGRVAVQSLTPAHLRKVYAALQESGLGPRTIGHVHRVVHNSLGQAARDGVVARNVAALVSPPRVPTSDVVSLDAAQVRRLLAEADANRLGALFVLAVTTGMREGELLGLPWAAVDLNAGTVRVQRTLVGVRRGQPLYQEPKTASARRTVTLSKTALAALKAHRVKQAEERLAAIGWLNDDLVFTNRIGGELQASHFIRDVWAPIRTAAGVPDSVTFHALRHTAASLSLAAGVPVATVSAMLGHANAGITMRIYAHAIPGTQQLAADAMDRLAAGT